MIGVNRGVGRQKEGMGKSRKVERGKLRWLEEYKTNGEEPGL